MTTFVVADLGKKPGSIRSHRRLQTEPCLLIMAQETDSSDSSPMQTSAEVDCFDPSSGHISHIVGGNNQTDLINKVYQGEIESGETTLMQDGAYFDKEGSLVITDSDKVHYNDGNDGGVSRKRRRLDPSSGTLNVIVVRVVALDSSPTLSEDEIRDAWFGTGGDTMTFKSQYESCTFNKAEVNPVDDSSSITGTQVINGVTTVNINMRVTGQVKYTVAFEAYKTAWKALKGIDFDHLVLCLPPGTKGNWIAYAYVNFFLSVFNDEHIASTSAQLHGKLLFPFTFLYYVNNLSKDSNYEYLVRNHWLHVTFVLSV